MSGTDDRAASADDGATVQDAARGPEAPKRDVEAGEDAPRSPRGPGVRWIVLGALVLAAGIAFVDRFIVAYVEREAAARAGGDFDVMVAAMDKGSADLGEEEKQDLRSAVAGQPLILAGYAAVLLLLPIAIGTLIGRGASSIMGAAIAVGAGAAAGLAMVQVQPLSLAIAAAAYFGLGALAGLVGKRLAKRRARA